MSSQKTVAVFGATGIQGSSVVRALAATKQYTIRGITRNPNSPAAQTLLAQVSGITLLQANIDDPATLAPVLAGVHAIFSVTNYWEHLFTGSTRTQAGEKEFAQAMTVARAAAQIPTLEHFIWSTQPDVSALTGGKHVVPHCDFKGRANAAMKSELPELAARTTFLIADFYPSNLVFMPVCMPHEVPGSHGCHVILIPCAPETRIPHTGSMASNFGVWVRQVLVHGERTRGRYVITRVGWTTWREMCDIWAEAGGKRVVVSKVAREDFEALWGVAGQELVSQFAWQEDVTATEADYADWYKDSGLLVEPGEIGIEVDKLVGFRGALEEFKALGSFS